MENQKKQSDTEKRVAIYIRVSTDEQTEKYGPIVQRERLIAFCRSQPNYSLDEKRHIYYDDGFSGSLPIEERPEMSRMFEAAKNKEFDVILVYRFDRFFRNTKYLLDAIDRLTSNGVAFRSTTEPFDTSDPVFGRLITTILGSISEAEREAIKLRMQSGRKRAAKDNKWVWGQPPYGYRLKKGKSKKLVVYKEEAEWVKIFFKWLVDEKLSLGGIQKRANEMKVPCYMLKKRRHEENAGYWHKSSIARILCNPIYTGSDDFYRYKRGKKRLSVLINDEQQRDKQQWVSFKTEAIITPERFELAKRQLLMNRSMASRNLKNIYLFNKLLYCGKCGLKMFAGNKPPKNTEQSIHRFYQGTREPKWKREHIVNGTRCKSCGEVGETRLESVWDTLKELLMNPEYMLEKLRDYDIPIPSDETRDKLEQTSDRLVIIQQRRKRISQVYESSGVMDYVDFQKKIDECKRDEDKIKNEISLLNQKILRKDEVKASAEHFENLFEELKDKIMNATYEEKSEVIHLLVEKIHIYKYKELAEVRLNVPVFPTPVISEGENDQSSKQTNDTLYPHRLYRVSLADI
jgi:site-specific DNA recombinase